MNWTKMVLVSALAVILAIAHPDRCHAQQVALKTNLLYDATLTPNLGLEMGVGKKHSVQLFYGLNAWKFGHGEDRKYAKHWLLNPEYRYWFCHRFNGSFVGIHAFGGEYDASNPSATGKICATIASRAGTSVAASAMATSGSSLVTGTSKPPSVLALPTLTTTSSSAAPVERRLKTATRSTWAPRRPLSRWSTCSKQSLIIYIAYLRSLS